jgi:hypothetical protein
MSERVQPEHLRAAQKICDAQMRYNRDNRGCFPQALAQIMADCGLVAKEENAEERLVDSGLSGGGRSGDVPMATFEVGVQAPIEPAENNPRCTDQLWEDGSIYLCKLPLGHDGPHENGEWEWWTFDSDLERSHPPLVDRSAEPGL